LTVSHTKETVKKQKQQASQHKDETVLILSVNEAVNANQCNGQ
jgi:hypothetical protein